MLNGEGGVSVFLPPLPFFPPPHFFSHPGQWLSTPAWTRQDTFSVAMSPPHDAGPPGLVRLCWQDTPRPGGELCRNEHPPLIIKKRASPKRGEVFLARKSARGSRRGTEGEGCSSRFWGLTRGGVCVKCGKIARPGPSISSSV